MWNTHLKYIFNIMSLNWDNVLSLPIPKGTY